MTQIVTLPPERCSPFTSAPHCTTNKALHKDSLSVAVEYLRLGWRVLPLEPRGKKPLHGMGWKNIRLTEDELAAYWNETPCANLAVVCGGGLVVVDLDGPRAQRWWIKTFGFFPETPRARTGRPGGAHLYFRGRPEAKTWKPAEGVEVRAEGAYVAAPFSVHQNGTAYRWEPAPEGLNVPGCMLVPLAELPEQLYKPEAVRPAPAETQPERAAAARPTLTRAAARKPDLVLRIEQAYANGEIQKGQRSNKDMAGAVSWLNAKAPRDTMEAWLKTLPKAQETPGYAKRTAAKAEQFFLANPPSARVFTAQVAQRAFSTPWPGHSGDQTKRVLLAHAFVVQRCGQLRHGLSVREAAELADVGIATVTRARKILFAKGLLKKLPPNHAGTGCFLLQLPISGTVFPATPAPLPPQTVRQDCSTILQFGRHDVFREKLPRSAESTWITLLNEGGEAGSLAALARLTGRCRDTERKNVLALEAVGLVERRGRRIKVLVRDLDTLAVKLGTAGACERKRERHQREREDFEAVASVRDLLKDVERRRRHGPLPLEYGRAQGPLPEIQPKSGRPVPSGELAAARSAERMTDTGKTWEHQPETVLATIERGNEYQTRVTQIGEGDELAVDVRLFWKKDDDTWLPTKKGVRFLKKDVKPLVEALAKAL